MTTVPDYVLDAMADAVWEKIGTMSMEEVRGMLETAMAAGIRRYALENALIENGERFLDAMGEETEFGLPQYIEDAEQEALK